MGKRKVKIYDTTLRDGMQGMEVSFSLDDKIMLAGKLDEFGVDYIEGGFPFANEKEEGFFQALAEYPFKNSRLVAFGSTCKPGNDAGKDPGLNALLNAGTPAVTVVGKAWISHIESVLRIDGKENLRLVRDSIQYLKESGREVFFDAEHFFDGFRDHPEYCLELLYTAENAGADTLVLCDTNGGSVLGDFYEAYASVSKENFSDVGVHLHNDTGLAVAGSLMAVEQGFSHIQGTINGWGERCGNTDLCTVLPNLALKMGKDVLVPGAIEQLTPFSRYISEVANIVPDKRAPYVGMASFSHKAGQHADVLEKNEAIMEHLPAERVGNRRNILISELAGKSTIVHKLKPYGNFSKKDDVVKKLTADLKKREKEGYEFEAAEASFVLQIHKALGLYKPMGELLNFHLEIYKSIGEDAKTLGRLFWKIGPHQLMGVGTGNGPVAALDNALRDGLIGRYPFLEKIRLIDYKVRVINPSHAAESRVRVFISSGDGQQQWDTVGVHENIVEASWIALVDSFEYYYNLLL